MLTCEITDVSSQVLLAVSREELKVPMGCARRTTQPMVTARTREPIAPDTMMSDP